MVDFKKRTLFCKLTWDSEQGKKKLWFGKKWGDLDKREANSIAYKTGDGLVVVDIDVHDLDEIDKTLAKELHKLDGATVTTKRGMHYYFEHKLSSEFVNDSAYSEFVDVRSDGGIILAQYKGVSEHIAYKRTGKVYPKIPKKLLKRLRELRSIKKSRKQTRNQWSKAPKGNIHSTTLSYAGKDFHAGLSLDEVMFRGIEYVENYLGGTSREMKLMSARIKDAYKYWCDSRLSETPKIVDVADIGSDLSDKEIQGMLLSAQKSGAVELEKVMKQIKDKTKLTMATLKDTLSEAKTGGKGLSSYFKGNIVWDKNLGVFVEMTNQGTIYHSKAHFTQTVMSASGWMKPTDVMEHLCEVPAKSVLYKPDVNEIELIDEYGYDAINIYKGVDFGDVEVTKIPKLINKLLNNLFKSDMGAKENFIHWLAYIVQHRKRTGIAWGFFGASGSGKGLLNDIIARILGYKNCSLNIGDTNLQSDFNGYAHDKLFIHLNEIASDYHARSGVAGKLKTMVTDSHININLKFMPELIVENYCNVILNSNKSNPIDLDTDDRRWNMIVTNISLSSLDWFTVGKTGDKMISKSLQFGKYLMNLKIDDKKALHIMPKSNAKSSVVEQTINPLVLVGNAIKSGDFDTICDVLELDDSVLDVRETEIRNATTTGFWSSSLLKKVYLHTTGKHDIASILVNKYFIRPYLTTDKCKHRLNKRGYFL